MVDSLAEYRHGNVTWNATKRGVERQKETFSGTEMSFIPYSQISSITLDTTHHYKLSNLGLIVIFLGFMIKVLYDFFLQNYFTINDLVVWLWFSSAIGIIIIIIAIFLKTHRYHVTGAGINSRIWSIHLGFTLHDEDAEKFIEVVKRRM